MTEFQRPPLSHLGFKRYAPSVKLAPFVQCYWFIQSVPSHHTQTSEFLHPDGGMSITFNFSDNLTIDDGKHDGVGLIDGANTTTRVMHINGQFNAVGIRFLPAGARAFIGMPLNEVKSQLISFNEIPELGLQQLYQQLGDAKSHTDKINLIEKWLSKTIHQEQRPSDVVNASLHFLNHLHGNVNITAMANHFDINKRKLERLFNDQVGLTAKEYAQTRRIQQARLYLKQHPELSLTDIAYELGFYDQAHFTKLFKHVIGISPKIYQHKSQQNY
jgi:AraC-like DNA-binding protein